MSFFASVSPELRAQLLGSLKMSVQEVVYDVFGGSL